jgi:hypothetical protein
MTALFIALAWVVPCRGADVTPILKAVVQIRVSADGKVKAELASNLKSDLTAMDGVTVVDQDPDFILDIMAVDEPMGRVAVAASVDVPFGRKANAKSFRELLARSWKSEFKDEDWKAFADYLFPYRVTVLRQLRSGRKGQMKKICAEIARDFEVEVLKRKAVRTEATGQDEKN